VLQLPLRSACRCRKRLRAWKRRQAGGRTEGCRRGSTRAVLAARRGAVANRKAQARTAPTDGARAAHATEHEAEATASYCAGRSAKTGACASIDARSEQLCVKPRGVHGVACTCQAAAASGA
jgi:hypothetical protein